MTLMDELLEKAKGGPLSLDEKVALLNLVGLSTSGENYITLCPFHKEETPSFSISPEKMRFHCFGCGVKGKLIFEL